MRQQQPNIHVRPRPNYWSASANHRRSTRIHLPWHGLQRACKWTLAQVVAAWQRAESWELLRLPRDCKTKYVTLSWHFGGPVPGNCREAHWQDRGVALGAGWEARERQAQGQDVAQRVCWWSQTSQIGCQNWSYWANVGSNSGNKGGLIRAEGYYFGENSNWS